LSLKLEEQEKELKQKDHYKGVAEKEKKQFPIGNKVLTNFKSNGGSSIADFFSDQSSCRIEPPQEYEN
jgi:phosphotransferase system IIB component